MSNGSKWTRELNATVMVQTMEYLTEHSKNLELSIGQIIDRLVVNIQAPNSGIAASWVSEQFTLTTSSLKEDELKEAIYDVICMMVLPLFQAGNKPDDVWFEVLTRVEDILKQGSELGIL